MPLTQVSSRAIEDTLRYVLGANGTSDYTFTGPGLNGAVNDPTLTLSRGQTYIFENRSGGHPFYIKTSIANGGTNDAYNTGVTNNGGGNGTEIVFTVPHDAPDTLYYQCSSHSSMAGQLNIAGSVADGSITAAKLGNGSVTADKIGSGQVTEVKLATNAVTQTKIADNAVIVDKLPDNVISTAKIANNAVTDAKINGMAASKLTGALPAISGANLTNLPASGAATNLVTNGAMNVAQRDSGSGFTGVDQQEYTIDQFITLHSYGTSTINVINSSQSPDGFAKSYKVAVTSADTSIGSGQFMFIRHKIEAQNLQHLAYGTSSAKSITLSFYVRSNVTGTYAICLQQKDNGSKQVNGTYTINSANTWERKTFTFAGDTSGVINNDTGHGLDILWTLVAGSNRTSGSARSTWTAHADADESYGHTANVLSSTSNDWHLTGVQLEVGDSASDFAHESYAETLLKCQRYYYKQASVFYGFFGYGTNSGTNQMGNLIRPVSMRVQPTVTMTAGSYWASGPTAGGSGTFYSYAYGTTNSSNGPNLLNYELSAEL